MQTATAILPGLQRAHGEGRLAAAVVAGETRVQRLYQEGSAKIRLPKTPDAPGLTAILINTSGGLTGGDRLSWAVRAGPGAQVTVTTQACEKVYRARDGVAETSARLAVSEGARVDWLPQETILFDRGSLARRLDAEVAADGVLLAVEATLLGREAMGEVVRHGHFRDRWRIRRAGKLVFADDVALSGEIAAVTSAAASLGGARAFAQVLLIAPEAETRLTAARQALGAAGAASAWDGKLFARLVLPDGLALRRSLVPLIAVLRDGAPLPRAWSL